ncbi:MAG: 6-pyruvoyl tetrahydropterin synthase family protein [Candidatus Hadarchaeota archaeon]
MKIELKEGLGFSAAHFVIGHKKCEHLHGHNWRVGVTVEGEEDNRGLVVDFIELRQLLEKICQSYDHRLLMPADNPSLKRLEGGKKIRVSARNCEYEFPTEDVVWVPVLNITVEELARVFIDEVARALSAYPNVKKITVFVEEFPGESATEERTIRS